MKIISIVNQKGGVGKTTTAINLAGTLAAINKKVLLIDFDPQGNTSSGLGLDFNNRSKNIYNSIVNNENINDNISKTLIPDLDIVPSNMDLAGAEVELVNIDNREFVLQKCINSLDKKYDYILIDCPPSLGLLTINALLASETVIIPLQCEFFAIEGLAHLMETIERIKDNFNPKLTISGIVLTMYDKRNKLTEAVEKDVRGYLGELVYKSVIPRNVRLSEASSHGIPAILYDPNCSGSIAYMNLVKEIIKQNDGE